MEIIYESGPDPKPLVFGDVDMNQFFVNQYGYLCQKSTLSSYNILTNAVGMPCADQRERVHSTEPIKRILPAVKQIKF